MQAILTDPNGWITLAIGVLFGAIPSWLITKHYAAKEPKWATDMLAEFRKAGDTDFVATFERALKDHNITVDGGEF